MSERFYHLGMKVAIRRADDLILMVQKKSSTPFWEFPGGRIQNGESPEAALLREIQEETGLNDIINIRPLVMMVTRAVLDMGNGISGGLIVWYHAADVKSEPKIILSDEHLAYEWVSDHEARQRFRTQDHVAPENYR